MNICHYRSTHLKRVGITATRVYLCHVCVLDSSSYVDIWLLTNGALEMIVETILERGSGVGYAVADAGFPRGR